MAGILKELPVKVTSKSRTDKRYPSQLVVSAETIEATMASLRNLLSNLFIERSVTTRSKRLAAKLDGSSYIPVNLGILVPMKTTPFEDIYLLAVEPKNEA